MNGEGKRSDDGKPADIELMYLIDDVFVGGQPSEDPPKAGWQVECHTNRPDRARPHRTLD
ncbi:MAG: hypothetical protein KBA30_06785 [Clostridia bacterium]|nr:hypothetical protein [Clostridia bacterium]